MGAEQKSLDEENEPTARMRSLGFLSRAGPPRSFASKSRTLLLSASLPPWRLFGLLFLS